MDYKKSKSPVNTVTRDVLELWKETDNVYESVDGSAPYSILHIDKALLKKKKQSSL